VDLQYGRRTTGTRSRVNIAMNKLFTATLLLFLAMPASGQPSGEDILKNLQAHFPGVQDYTVKLDILPDIERLKVPPMQVTMFFKQPDKFHYESESFAVLPREGLSFSPAQLLARFDVMRVETEDSATGKYYELQLRAKDPRTKLFNLTLTVSAATWKPMRFVTMLMDRRTLTATFAYETQGEFTMPSLLTVQFASPDSSDQNTAKEEEMSPRRHQMLRGGKVTIRYSEYQINTGLSDDIFTTK
jgi:outer membrane lipoprotein-sorting protein